MGGLTCFSNMYFGLQSGWISLGSLQSALIGFAVLKVVAASSLFQRPNLVSRALGMGPFGPKENVRGLIAFIDGSGLTCVVCVVCNVSCVYRRSSRLPGRMRLGQ